MLPPDVRGVNRGNRVTDDASRFVTVRENVAHSCPASLGGCAEPGRPDNTALPPADPGRACAAIPACAAVLAHAGPRPGAGR
ncbi:hypothetical protein RB200_00165 [Streptomyces sp. PmtG]